jgi:tRNA(His) guanylyltransferase
MSTVEDIGDYIKDNFENKYRTILPSKTYTIIRIDGRAFHSYTKRFARPFDDVLMAAMDHAAEELLKQVGGAICAYVQSDEISILASDFGKESTEAWFGGNLQKIVSVSASIATNAFNKKLLGSSDVSNFEFASFDARVLSMTEDSDVLYYFKWRQADTMRNSVRSVANVHFSHKSLQNKSVKDMLAMLQERGVPWETFGEKYKFGRFFYKDTVVEDLTYTDKRTGEQRVELGVERRRIAVDARFFSDVSDLMLPGKPEGEGAVLRGKSGSAREVAESMGANTDEMEEETALFVDMITGRRLSPDDTEDSEIKEDRVHRESGATRAAKSVRV